MAGNSPVAGLGSSSPPSQPPGTRQRRRTWHAGDLESDEDEEGVAALGLGTLDIDDVMMVGEGGAPLPAAEWGSAVEATESGSFTTIRPPRGDAEGDAGGTAVGAGDGSIDGGAALLSAVGDGEQVDRGGLDDRLTNEEVTAHAELLAALRSKGSGVGAEWIGEAEALVTIFSSKLNVAQAVARYAKWVKVCGSPPTPSDTDMTAQL